MIISRVVGLAALTLVGLVAATAQTAVDKSSAPNRGPQDAKKGRPNFWDAKFNFASAFSNQGIATFRHGTLSSKKLRFNGAPETEIGYTIYLPPDYDNASATRYPVLYFLHGLGGNENTIAPVVQKAHALIATGELPPFIIASAAFGRSFYGNQFAGKCQTHDFFFDEFLPYIEGNYRVKPGRENRHLQGFSMGGYGALMFAFKHPDLFGAVTEIGGALLGARFNVWAEMYDAKEEHYRPFDLAVLVEENRKAIAALRIAQWIGSADSTRPANVQFHDLFTAKAIAHTYNDAAARPMLDGVPHDLTRYYAVHAKEILQFHTDAFGK